MCFDSVRNFPLADCHVEIKVNGQLVAEKTTSSAGSRVTFDVRAEEIEIVGRKEGYVQESVVFNRKASCIDPILQNRRAKDAECGKTIMLSPKFYGTEIRDCAVPESYDGSCSKSDECGEDCWDIDEKLTKLYYWKSGYFFRVQLTWGIDPPDLDLWVHGDQCPLGAVQPPSGPGIVGGVQGSSHGSRRAAG